MRRFPWGELALIVIAISVAYFVLRYYHLIGAPQ